jgi:hypothetical protein
VPPRGEAAKKQLELRCRMADELIADVIESIGNESVLLHASTKLPGGLNFEPKPVLAGWISDPQVKSAELDRLLNRAGWHYFFVPPEVHACALGFNNTHALSRALKKLMTRAQAERLNALQITTMRTKKSLGLHYAKCGANLRHIQDGLVLSPASERMLERATDNATRPLVKIGR